MDDLGVPFLLETPTSTQSGAPSFQPAILVYQKNASIISSQLPLKNNDKNPFQNSDLHRKSF